MPIDPSTIKWDSEPGQKTPVSASAPKIDASTIKWDQPTPAAAGTQQPTSDYEPLIAAAAQKYNLDPRLLRSQIQAESSFNPKAVSPVGAKGLMQLMPATAAEQGVNDPFDPAQNIEGGAKYMRKMLDANGGNWEKALAAYNWGPGNLAKKGFANAPEETRKYIKKVMAGAGDLDVPMPGADAPQYPADPAAQRQGDVTPSDDPLVNMAGRTAQSFYRGLFQDLPNAGGQVLGLMMPDALERKLDFQGKTIQERQNEGEADFERQRARMGGEGFDPARMAGNIANPATLALGMGGGTGAATGKLAQLFAKLSPKGQAVVGSMLRGGAGAGMMPMQGEGGLANKAEQVGFGAAFGPLAEGAGKLAIAGGGKLAGILGNQIRPGAKAVLDEAQQAGVKLSAGDIARENKMITGVEGALENARIPGLSMSGFRKEQQEAARAKGQRLLDEEFKRLQSMTFMGEDRIRALAAGTGPRSDEARKIMQMVDEAGTDERAIMKASGNMAYLRKKLSSDKNYQEVADLAGDAPVPPTNTIQAIDDALAGLQRVVDPDPQAERLLTSWRNRLTGVADEGDDGIEAAVRQFENQAPPTQLPGDLRRASPRYGLHQLNFESDLDKAAYIAAQTNPSKRDADYLEFMKRATGMSETQIRQRGADIKAALKAQTKGQQPGMVTVPAGQYPTARNPTAGQPQPAPAAPAGGEPPINTYTGMRGFRSDVLKRVQDATSGLTTDSSKLFLKNIAKAVERDMNDFADATPALREANQRAQRFYKDNVVPYQQSKLSNALSADDPDQIYGAFIRAQAEGRGDYAAQRLFKALDNKGRQAVRYGIVRQAMANAVDGDQFSPAKFRSALESTEYKQYFRGPEAARIDGVISLMGHLRRASPEHLQKYQAIMGGPIGTGTIGAGVGAGVATGNIGAMVSAAGFGGFLRWLMTSDAGKRILFSSNVLAKGGSQEKIGRLLDDAARQYNTAAGAAAGNLSGK